MKVSHIRLGLTVLLMLFLTACKTVSVSNPAGGKVYTTPPDLTLSFPQGKPDVFQVLLNKKDITGLLTITASGASATGATIQSALVDGENFLEVTKPFTPIVKFTYDISGPMVHMTTVQEGSQLNLQGYVEDPSGVKSVTLNGVALALDANSKFNTTIANTTMVTFVSTDTNNLVRTQKFARPGVSVTDSMSLRISRSGLDFLTKEVVALLTSPSLSSMVTLLNPVKQESILGNSYKLNVLDASIKTAALNLAVKPTGDGSFAVSGTFGNVWAKFSVPYSTWFFSSTIDGTLTVASTSFTADAKVVIVNNKPSLSMGKVTVSLNTLRTDINNFPDWLLTPIYDAFNFLIELIAADQVKQIIPKKMAELLDTFPDTLVLNVNGNKLKPAIIPSTISSPSNGLNLSLGAKLTAVTTNGPRVVGSPWKDMGVVPTASNVSPTGVVKDLGIVISSNMINQALSAATASGMLNMTITDSDIPGLTNTSGVTSGQHARARVIPASAPTIELVKSTDALGTLRIHDLYLALDATTDPANPSVFKTLMGATIDVEVTANIGVTPSSALAIDIAGVPRLKIRSIDSNSLLVLAPDLAQKFMDEITVKVLPVVMSMIGAIPLPSFKGYSISVGEIWVTDANANFAGVVASMIHNTVQAKAPAPATYARVENGSVSAVSGVRSVAAANAVTVEGNTAVIALDGYNPSKGRLQYRYSLDGALFSLWRERDTLRLGGLQAGLHTVKVCARTALLVEDPDCTDVSFVIGTP